MRVVRISEIAAPSKYSVVGGPFGSKLGTKDYVADGVPVVRGANLPMDRRFDLNDLVFVTEEKVETDLFGNLAYPGDVVVTQRGTLGQVGLVPLDCPYDRLVVSQSQMKLTVNESLADPRFVYYALRSPVAHKELNDLAISSGVPHINLDIFRNFRLPMPDLEVQRQVADVLWAFDDLIENNRRRIEIMEEMARLLYREWFVHFRFPGHEGVEMVDSELGPIPARWAAAPFSTAVAINPRLKIDKTQDHPFITMGDLSEHNMVCSPSERKAGSSGAKFENGDTLFARITPCLENGKTGSSSKPSSTARSAVAPRSSSYFAET